MKQCESCGKDTCDPFYVIHGFSEGPFKVGDCCGVRATGLIKPEYAGPLLKQKDHSESSDKADLQAPYAPQ